MMKLRCAKKKPRTTLLYLGPYGMGLGPLPSETISKKMNKANIVNYLFIELKEHTSSQYNFESGYGGDRAVVEYLKDYISIHPDISRNELDELRKELYPNGSKTEFIKEFGE